MKKEDLKTTMIDSARFHVEQLAIAVKKGRTGNDLEGFVLRTLNQMVAEMDLIDVESEKPEYANA